MNLDAVSFSLARYLAWTSSVIRSVSLAWPAERTVKDRMRAQRMAKMCNRDIAGLRIEFRTACYVLVWLIDVSEVKSWVKRRPFGEAQKLDCLLCKFRRFQCASSDRLSARAHRVSTWLSQIIARLFRALKARLGPSGAVFWCALSSILLQPWYGSSIATF